MKTVLTKSPERAAEFIRNGGIVAFPTETVYGLGASVFDENAIEKIFKAKRRPNDNPLIAHVGSVEQINLLVEKITPNAEKFIEAFFPAPLTLVLPKRARVPSAATAGLETIGVRMPEHELAQEFLKFCMSPVVAPSANLSGKPSPTNWEAVYEDLNGRIDCILQGEMTKFGLESTVVDCASDAPLVLRSGAISIEQLREIVPETELYEIAENEQPRSPGMKHKHYAPRAKVVLVDENSETNYEKSRAFIGLNNPFGNFESVKICDSVEDYAHSLFDFFRRCDREKIEIIYCQKVEEKGIGAALMDRLRRAAEN